MSGFLMGRTTTWVRGDGRDKLLTVPVSGDRRACWVYEITFAHCADTGPGKRRRAEVAVADTAFQDFGGSLTCKLFYPFDGHLRTSYCTRKPGGAPAALWQ
jgi:hypothetical protein